MDDLNDFINSLQNISRLPQSFRVISRLPWSISHIFFSLITLIIEDVVKSLAIHYLYLLSKSFQVSKLNCIDAFIAILYNTKQSSCFYIGPTKIIKALKYYKFLKHTQFLYCYIWISDWNTQIPKYFFQLINTI